MESGHHFYLFFFRSLPDFRSLPSDHLLIAFDLCGLLLLYVHVQAPMLITLIYMCVYVLRVYVRVETLILITYIYIYIYIYIVCMCV